MGDMKRILIAGSTGFIGHHLVTTLKTDSHLPPDERVWVRGADVKMLEYPGPHERAPDEFLLTDLREYANCLKATEGIDEVYQLAADMGGIGYITAHLAEVARNNVLINVNMLDACRANRVKRYLYTSSACVYAQSKQSSALVAPLKEEDAYPAEPEPGYGWEKLFSEQMCHYFARDFGMDVRIVRFHNVYGPYGTFDGGREKAPAALCRKIALAPDPGTIEVWGDGCQTRSFMYIDDCVEGLQRIMVSECSEPLNLGTDELVTVDGLVDIISKISGKRIAKHYNLAAPEGVRGRNSDNTRLRKAVGWEPQIRLAAGLAPTYRWIEQQVKSHRYQPKESTTAA